jgi:uncharacterized protein
MTETPPPAPAAPLSDSDARMYATIAHAGNIVFPAIAPLIMWLIGKDKSTFVDTEAKEALNFGILAAIVYIVSSFLMIIVIGFLTWAVMAVVALIFGIQGAMKANKGENYRYPFSLRLIK